MTDTIEIHSTDRQQFKRCRQLWDFTSNLRMNLEAVRTSMNALDFGTGFHLAKAAYYDEGRKIEVARSVWYDYCDSLPYDVADEEVELGARMLDYLGKWALANDNFVWLGSELESKLEIGKTAFQLPYPQGTPIVYSYRLDGLVQKDGLFYIVETKTAAKWQTSYDYLLTDTQCGSYLWCEQLKRHVPIEGVIYDIHRKAYPKPLRVLKNGEYSTAVDQDTTFDIARKALFDRYGPLEKVPDEYRALLANLSTKPDNFIQRHIIRRNQQEIKRIGDGIFDEITDMINDPKIYRTDSAGNCNQCAFLDPCLLKWEGSDYRQILELRYKSRRVAEEPMGPNELDEIADANAYEDMGRPYERE